MFKRVMGKLAFIHIQDVFAKIQVSIGRNEISEEDFAFFKSNVDTGDFIGIVGELYNTHTGELTIRTHKFKLLSKAIKPLPDKFHGLNDVDLRYRQRYLDLLMNEKSRQVLLGRSKMISFIRNYLEQNGFIEVETPIIQGAVCGASAKPFMTKHNALDKDCNLRIAPETYLKQVVAGGFNRVFEVAKCFRNEGMDTKHNPEFTLMEAYLAYSDLEGMMDLTEKMYQTIANEVCGKTTFKYLGHEIDLSGKWKRISMVDAIKEKTNIDFKKEMTVEEALKLASEHGIEVQEHEKSVGHIINLFFEKYVEETLIEPTFLYGHPIEISPLTKKDSEDPRFTQRFELFISGHECANAYTELNDPIDQLERFEAQLKEKDLGNDEANDIDMDFIEALEYGMPPAGGIGYGIDRMIMLFTESESIRDVILFPTMKPNKEQQ